MWRRVDLVWTDVSEESIASIFRVEKSAIGEPAGRLGGTDRYATRSVANAIHIANLLLTPFLSM
jgi:hypothetical protein